MKYKILDIKRRNWFGRCIGIEHWKVTVQVTTEKSIKTHNINCWAGDGDGARPPISQKLLSDLENNIRRIYTPPKPQPTLEELRETMIKELKGKEVVERFPQK